MMNKLVVNTFSNIPGVHAPAPPCEVAALEPRRLSVKPFLKHLACSWEGCSRPLHAQDPGTSACKWRSFLAPPRASIQRGHVHS